MSPSVRRNKKFKKRVESETGYRLCGFCNCSQKAAIFKKHVGACKKLWKINHENKGIFSRRPDVQLGSASYAIIGPQLRDDSEDRDNGPVPMDVDEVLDPRLTSTVETNQDLVVFGPTSLPDEYIKVIPHPNSVDPTPLIIPITLSAGNAAVSTQRSSHSRSPRSLKALTLPYRPPWAPFKNLSDFEFTEMAIKSLDSKEVVNMRLKAIHERWSIGGSYLTLKTFNDMEQVLLKARRNFVQFKQARVSSTYLGKVSEFTFEYCDPWDWIVEIIQDKSLSEFCMWNSVEKFYCQGDFTDQIRDEINTGKTWWAVDSELQHLGQNAYPRVYLPLHFWLDKGMVTRSQEKLWKA